MPQPRLRGDAGSKAVGDQGAHVVVVNQGAHAMLDRMGPNIASGPIPRDGFTTSAYENFTRKKLHVRTDLMSTRFRPTPRRFPISSHPAPLPELTRLSPHRTYHTSLQEMGYSDVRGEHGERPEELDNGIDHLDKLETVLEQAIRTRTRTARSSATIRSFALLPFVPFHPSPISC